VAQEHSETEILEGQVIPYQPRGQVPTYRIPTPTRLPERQRPERSGWFGFIEDHQEAAHIRRLNQITEKIIEADHGGRSALALDADLVKATGDTAETMHATVVNYQPGSIGETTSAELTGLAIARNRLRVAAIGDAVDAYILNILQRG
jgi:hypothetical protein